MSARREWNGRMRALAEHFGLIWVNEFDMDTNPHGEVGHFETREGLRSADICLIDICYTDEAKRVLKLELSNLLGYEFDWSGI